jgi:hypothetical protein
MFQGFSYRKPLNMKRLAKTHFWYFQSETNTFKGIIHCLSSNDRLENVHSWMKFQKFGIIKIYLSLDQADG